MRVLLVNTYYYPEIYGGAEYSVKKLAEALVQSGNQCAVLCTSVSDKDEVIDGVLIYRRGMKKIAWGRDISACKKAVKAVHRMQELWCAGNRKILEQVIDEFRPDVVHTNNLYAITPLVWKVVKEKGIYLVHTLRDYYLMCPRVALLCGRCRERCVKPGVLCRIHRGINRGNTGFVDFVTAPSNVTLRTVTDSGMFRSAEKRVVANAVDFSPEETLRILEERRKERSNKKTGIRFVYLGTLSKQKGILWMTEAFLQIQNQDGELYIAGKGELESYVKELSVRDSRIQFMGFLSEEEVERLLLKCDVLICPSVWDEPFGRVILDAYKGAMPVIASDRGALPELVEEDRTGFIVKVNDTRLLAEKMQSYLEKPEQTLRHGENAIEKLMEFTISNQREEFLEIYKGGVKK